MHGKYMRSWVTGRKGYDMPINYGSILKRLLKRSPLLHWQFPGGPVTVTLRDGSAFIFYDAFCLRDKKKEMVHVFTEHHGYHTFEDFEIIFYSGPIKPRLRRKKKAVAK